MSCLGISARRFGTKGGPAGGWALGLIGRCCCSRYGCAVRCRTRTRSATRPAVSRIGQLRPPDGGRLYGLADEQTVYAALDAIDEALEQALIAPTERDQRWQLNQLRGLLLSLRSADLSLEDSLRRLIRLLRTSMIDR